MAWQYRIRKRMIDGKPWYDVIEYYSLKQEGNMWTAESMEPCGESRKEVILSLKRMLKDVTRTKVFVEKEKKHGKNK